MSSPARFGLLLATSLLAVAAFVVAIGVDASAPVHGDEGFYLDSARQLAREGVIATLAEGQSVGFGAAVVSLTLLGVPELPAARIVSLLAACLLLAGQWVLSRRVLRLDRELVAVLLLTSTAILVGSGCLFAGISDGLFSAVVLWAMVVTVMALEPASAPATPILAGALWAFSLLVRPLTILYLPGLFVATGTVLWLRPRPCRSRVAALLVTITALIALQQTPSLVRYGAPRFESKAPENGMTWTQRQFLTKLLIERGERKNPHLVEWDEVARYLEIHGEDALPRSLSEAVVWDPWGTLRAFASNVVFHVPYIFLRRCGFFFPLALAAVCSGGWRGERRWPSAYTLIVVAAYVLTLSLVVVTGLHWRWLLAATLLICPIGAAALAGPEPRRWASGAVIAQLLFVNVSILFDLAYKLGLRQG